MEETVGQVRVFHLGGKIMGDAPTQAFCRHFNELIDAGTRILVVDFRQVRWINSTGIGVIIACLNAIRDRGGDIRFANLHDASAQYFLISKLETVVQMFNDVEATIASFGEGEMRRPSLHVGTLARLYHFLHIYASASLRPDALI